MREEDDVIVSVGVALGEELVGGKSVIDSGGWSHRSSELEDGKT